MRLVAFRFPVEHVEGEDVQETLPRVAALIDVRVPPTRPAGFAGLHNEMLLDPQRSSAFLVYR